MLLARWRTRRPNRNVNQLNICFLLQLDRIVLFPCRTRLTNNFSSYKCEIPTFLHANTYIQCYIAKSFLNPYIAMVILWGCLQHLGLHYFMVRLYGAGRECSNFNFSTQLVSPTIDDGLRPCPTKTLRTPSIADNVDLITWVSHQHIVNLRAL